MRKTPTNEQLLEDLSIENTKHVRLVDQTRDDVRRALKALTNAPPDLENVLETEVLRKFDEARGAHKRAIDAWEQWKKQHSYRHTG